MRNTATADARRPGGAVWPVWVPRQYGKYSECGVPTCCATGGHSNSLRMTGEGLTFRERLLHRIRCPKCDVDLSAGSMETHWHVHHEVVRGYFRATPPSPPGCTHDVLDILPSGGTRHHMPSGRVSG